MKYKCGNIDCRQVIEIKTKERTSFRCGGCNGYTGSFLGNIDRIECGYCGKVRKVIKGEILDMRNTCHFARKLGSNTMWIAHGIPILKGPKKGGE